jgi:hypothetical protein
MVAPRVDGAAASEPIELADRVTMAVLAVPGVTGMHGGQHGVTATYLPGRRIVGVRLREDHTEVHITVSGDQPVRPVADEVRRVVGLLVNQPVHVTVEDLTP